MCWFPYFLVDHSSLSSRAVVPFPLVALGPTYDRSARLLTGTKLLLYIFTDFDVALIDVRVVDS